MNTKEAEAEASRGKKKKKVSVRLDAALALLFSASFPSTDDSVWPIIADAIFMVLSAAEF